VNLFPFQEAAIKEIRDKFLRYKGAPNMTEGQIDPFIQFLRAITGAGKTPILAEIVSEISLAYNCAPVVLWTSKTTAVVGQTLINLDNGGKYRSFLQDFMVKDISDVRIEDVLNPTNKLVITSTVASFNRTSRDGLKIFTPQTDLSGDISLWDALSQRNGKPLFIVYDEGHNTTDNQVDLLFELKPDVMLLASATPRATMRLRSFIKGELDEQETIKKVVTTIETKHVVENELIKSTIRVTDYDNPEEFVIQDLITQYHEAEKLANESNVAIQPKCIYVSTTNDANDLGLPFYQRKSRPVVIWRTLVEKLNVSASTIAVYCSLKGSDFPGDFHLVRKFEDLQKGDYKHIIFNLGLQEGWDDPEVYFAYIDKTLNSATEITQVIGRVLRQPGAKRTQYEILNSAHFFVNCPTDRFSAVINGIKTEIGTYYNDPGNDYIRVIEQPKRKPEPLPVKEDRERTIPKLAIKVDPYAVEEMVKELKKFPDYGKLPDQSLSSGKQQTKVVEVETGETEDLKNTQGFGQMITMGELFRKELHRLAKDAAETLDGELTKTEKFCAEICYGSEAAKHVRSLALDIAKTYLDHVAIETGIEEFTVPPFQLSSATYNKYNNSLHDGYDGLNSNEEDAANALDILGYHWFRNLPNADGYKIPLPLITINAKNFFPDFIVFGKKTIWCIDPKGGHLLNDAISDKLVENIRLTDNLTMKVILLTKGEVKIVDGKLMPLNKRGVTLLGKRGPRSVQFIKYYKDCFSCFEEILTET